METKICTKCGEEKSLTEFNFKNKARNKRQAQCKECQRKRERELYNEKYKYENKDLYNENRRKWKSEMRKLTRDLKSCGCVICGEKEPCCLDFHHLKDKKFEVSKAPNVSKGRLYAEVQKCIVLCANCHRKVHAGKITLKESVYINYNSMTIKFKRLSENAIAPVKAHATDAGFDLTCVGITTEINECGQLILVYHTGIAVEIPEGYFGALVPRSSIYKKSLMLTNHIGVIDSGYRGEVVGKFRSTTDVVPAVIKEGERFAQLLILPVPEVTFEESDILSETERGEGGYGSTDNIEESAATPLQQQDSVIDAKDDATSAEAVSASEQAAGQIDGPEEAQ